MTLSSYQRSIVTLISQQEMLGKGMHMNPEEFAQWACREYGITRHELTEWRRQLLVGG